MKMTQTELAVALQIHLKQNGINLNGAEIKNVLNGLGSIAQSALQNGKEVPLPGIGKLKAAERAARTGRNPQTGEAIAIAAKNVVKFSVSKSLSDALN